MNQAKNTKDIAISTFRSSVLSIRGEKSPFAFNTPMIMSGNNVNNYYEKNVPGVFSQKTVTALRTGVGASVSRKLGGM